MNCLILRMAKVLRMDWMLRVRLGPHFQNSDDQKSVEVISNTLCKNLFFPECTLSSLAKRKNIRLYTTIKKVDYCEFYFGYMYFLTSYRNWNFFFHQQWAVAPPTPQSVQTVPAVSSNHMPFQRVSWLMVTLAVSHTDIPHP